MSHPRGSAPLVVTAELPVDLFAWSNQLRTEHFPAHRNYLKAHVTLFHALPPKVEGELRELLARWGLTHSLIDLTDLDAELLRPLASLGAGRESSTRSRTSS